MTGRLVATLVGSARARTALSHAVKAFAILLLLLALRRSGKRTDRLAEQLETIEKTFDAPRQMLERVARRFLVGASWLSGCTAAGVEAVGVAAWPPVVAYSREFQARAVGDDWPSMQRPEIPTSMVQPSPTLHHFADGCVGAPGGSSQNLHLGVSFLPHNPD